MRSRLVGASALALFTYATCAASACGRPAPARSDADAAPETSSSPSAVTEAPPRSTDAAPADRDGASAMSATTGAADGSSAPGACPADMVHVETDFCSDMERRCLDMEHEEKNNLDICHAYAHEQRCRGTERHLSSCIDRYEYPNQKGAHPVWMLDWSQAQATCESKGKRLCWASEWTAACEGPDHTPFPYGWERDHDTCNMDNFYIDPARPGPKAQFFFYSKDPAVALPELARLDQSVPSGSLEGCRSGFGVYDMPGNVDEWVQSDEPPHEKSKWAGLKGGAWGHVRSQCRPETFSHDPEFYYYFVGFRCCQGAAGAPPWEPSPQAAAAPSVEAHDFAPEPIVATGAPGPSKTKFSRTGRRE